MSFTQQIYGQPILAVVLAILTGSSVWCQDAKVDDAGKKQVAAKQLVVILDNGDELQVAIPDSEIELKTRYGLLKIPMADVQRIQLAVRVSVIMSNVIQEHIDRLNSEKFSVREDAARALFAAGKKCYPAMQANRMHKDPETRLHVDRLLKQLSAKFPGLRDDDLVHAGTSEIAGEILNDRFTFQLGGTENVDYSTFQVEGIFTQEALVAARESKANSAPVNAEAIQGRIGDVFEFRVTGVMGGGVVWGTGPYTSDSSIAAAAIHAGLVAEGETEVVKLKIVTPPAEFSGSEANGVTTSSYGEFPGAFKFVTEAE